MHMVRIGPSENWGRPSWNGASNPMPAEPTAPKLILPIAAATTAPITIADQHRNVGDETLAEFADAENDEKHEQRQAESAERIAVRIRNHAIEGAVDDIRNHMRSLGPIYADAHQRHADDEDDRAGDDGRKQADQGTHQRRRDDGEERLRP